MSKTFTENDLVSYVYGESTPETTQNIKQSAIQDDELQDRISSMLDMKLALDRFELKVPQHITDKILWRVGCMDKLSV